MVQSQSSAGTTHYTVNSDGLRVRKVNTGSTNANEWFVYDEQRRLIGLYDLSSTQLDIREELVYRPESWALAFTIRGQTAGASGSAGIAYPILSDNIGTPRVVLDPTNGHKRWSWEAKEAFGMQAPVENPQNDVNFVFNARFPGQWFDEEAGLFQNGYRDYNPQTGRYMQSDPIGLSAGWNTYGYVGGNPQNNMDPLGLDIIQDAFDYWKPPAIPQPIVNLTAGWGDSLSSIPFTDVSISKWIRSQMGNDDHVVCDDYYSGGQAIGIVNQIAVGGVGGAKGLMKMDQRGVPQGMVKVSRWGRDGLQDGDWVSVGSQNIFNRALSGFRNGAGQTYIVPKTSLKNPSLYRPANEPKVISSTKEFLGINYIQRIYKP